MSTVWKVDTTNDGPKALAWRMAGYNRDANYIRAMVMRDHGTAPTTSEIKSMIETQIKRREKFKRLSDERVTGQRNFNDNGDEYQVRYIGPGRNFRRYKRSDGGFSNVEVKHKEVIADGDIPPLTEPFTAKALIKQVGRGFRMTYHDVVGPSRFRENVCARAVVAKLLYERNSAVYSFPRIARELGRSDQSTIGHLLRTFDKRCQQYPAMYKVYKALGGTE